MKTEQDAMREAVDNIASTYFRELSTKDYNAMLDGIVAELPQAAPVHQEHTRQWTLSVVRALVSIVGEETLENDLRADATALIKMLENKGHSLAAQGL